MTRAREMLEAAPAGPPLDLDDLAAAIERCLECAQACTACADACLSQETVSELRACIALDLQCADLCSATARVLSRDFTHAHAVVEHLLQACVLACGECATECERHAGHHRHCALCAESCRRCAVACGRLLSDAIAEELRRVQGG